MYYPCEFFSQDIMQELFVMQQITTISSNPIQQMQLVLENNDTVDFKLYYSMREQSWFYDFSYKDLTVNGSKVTLHPNALRQFRRIIPFGIAFDSDGQVEPFAQDDFSSGRIKMYILNSEDIQSVEQEVFNS